MCADEPAEQVSVKLAQIERSSGKILIINCILLLLLTLGRRVTVVVLSLVNPRPEGYGSRFVVRSVHRATESNAHFFAPVMVRTG